MDIFHAENMRDKKTDAVYRLKKGKARVIKKITIPAQSRVGIVIKEFPALYIGLHPILLAVV